MCSDLDDSCDGGWDRRWAVVAKLVSFIWSLLVRRMLSSRRSPCNSPELVKRAGGEAGLDLNSQLNNTWGLLFGSVAENPKGDHFGCLFWILAEEIRPGKASRTQKGIKISPAAGFPTQTKTVPKNSKMDIWRLENMEHVKKEAKKGEKTKKYQKDKR